MWSGQPAGRPDPQSDLLKYPGQEYREAKPAGSGAVVQHEIRTVRFAAGAVRSRPLQDKMEFYGKGEGEYHEVYDTQPRWAAR